MKKSTKRKLNIVVNIFAVFSMLVVLAAYVLPLVPHTHKDLFMNKTLTLETIPPAGTYLCHAHARLSGNKLLTPVFVKRSTGECRYSGT